MAKKRSYKDYLQEEKEKEKTPVAEEVDSKDTEEEINFVEAEVDYQSQPTMTVMDNTAITETLEEQREESKKMLETLAESNARLVETAERIVENNSESNEKLVEAIASLAEKIELLESKIEDIKDLEIPTPIVQLHQPKVHKEVHRDKKGVITHITESPVDSDDDGEE